MILFLVIWILATMYVYSQVTIGGGFIRDTGIGGLFIVNTSSPTIDTAGEISVSEVNTSPAVWIWIGGNRYEFTLTLNNPVQDYALLEIGDFILQEDGSSKIALE